MDSSFDFVNGFSTMSPNSEDQFSNLINEHTFNQLSPPPTTDLNFLESPNLSSDLDLGPTGFEPSITTTVGLEGQPYDPPHVAIPPMLQADFTSSPDDSDFSETVLKYINQILMEEDIENKPCMFYDPLGLKDTEKSFYDALGQENTTLPNQNSVESPVFSSSSGDNGTNNTSSSSTVNDSLWQSDLGKHNYQPSLSPPPVLGEHNAVQSNFNPTYQSQFFGNLPNGSVNHFGDVLEIMAQNFFTNCESILQFRRGLEEASKFLPKSNNLVIDLESNTVSSSEWKGEDLKVEALVVKGEKESDSPDGSRGRKNREREEIELEEGRSNKQTAVYVEEDELSDMFDKVLLCTDAPASMCGDNCEPLQNDASKASLHTIGQAPTLSRSLALSLSLSHTHAPISHFSAMAKRNSSSKSVTKRTPKVEALPQAAAAPDLNEEEVSSSPSKRRAVEEESAVARRVLRSSSVTKKKQEVEAQPQEKEESSSPRKRRAVEEESEMAKLKSRSKSVTEKKRRVEEQPQAAAPKEEEESSSPRRAVEKKDDDEEDSRFVGEPVPDQEARQRWPKRYEEKGKVIRSKDESDEIILARRHYTQAEVDGQILYNLYDDAHVKAPEGMPSYIGKIVEMFEAVDGGFYFTAQWYYRAEDTVIQNCHNLIDNKRVFYSEIQNDNPLDCLIEKLTIARIPLDVDPANRTIPNCDYYCDMLYLLPYSTFVKLPTEERHSSCEASSTISCECDMNGTEQEEDFKVQDHSKTEVSLLDLYSGCGAMSTGLCLGANLFGLHLVTRWAVDLNRYACESLRLNHLETEVRNESAEDFLLLLEEWEKLCCYFSLLKSDAVPQVYADLFVADDGDGSDEDNDNDDADDEDGEVFEVEKILGICYGDPNETKQRELYLKVRWKGYGADEDTWEPIMGLGNCVKTIKEFVTNGYRSKVLPLPGDVDVICGGPPCQGISGFNRFRNKENPLDDDKNKQLIVYMNLVQYLKPRYVLMENVVDLVKFANGFLGRYALGRLIGMNYQVRMGMMAAGAYGLPQFRMRVFLWGAQPTENLPQFPLPTHDVVVRGVIPLEFEKNTVAHDEGHNLKLEEKLLLKDAISDLPAVENNECRDEMPYSGPPQTEFQKLIRLGRDELLGLPKQETLECVLYDHRPLALNNDDYERVCEIPQKKGANFRDLPGVRICSDSNKNKVEWDPDVERVYLKSGKPLVPDYAMSFVNGTSSKPFARLWWDETVPTVVTRAEPHNQAILHPVQNRVLTIRENARLQGFPDCYKLCGPVKERYIQVGNAVAVPVARALGYALGSAFQGSSGVNEPVFRLPPKFPNISGVCSSAASEDDA